MTWYKLRPEPPIRAFRVGYDPIPPWLLVDTLWEDREGIALSVLPNPTLHTPYTVEELFELDAPLNPQSITLVEYRSPTCSGAASDGEWILFYGTHLVTMFDDAFQERYEETVEPFVPQPSPEPEKPMSLYEMFIRQGLF